GPHHGRLDLAAAATERSRHDRDRPAPAVGALDDALGLGAALAGDKCLAQPAHDRGVRREHLLDVAALRAPRRALGEHLGRGVPEDDAQIGVDRDHRVREAGEDGLVVHWSGDREAGLDRGWPEPGAAKLRTPDLSDSVVRLCFTLVWSARIAR